MSATLSDPAKTAFALEDDYRESRPMNTKDPKPGERVTDVRVSDDMLHVDLLDGRTISVPLAWYPRLLHATPEQCAHWKIAGGGFGIHWPDVNEDLSSEGLLHGSPAPRMRTRAAS